MARKYKLKKRAETQAQTRQRIVRATVDLHGTLGPARTSISAIAERAGVQRVTIYDHFPDEHALFQACTEHFFAEHPPPDPEQWRDIQDPTERLRTALGEIYAYHRRTEPMMALIHRDAELKPVMWQVEATQAQIRYWQQLVAELVEPWNVLQGGQRRLIAAIQHALEFQTWRSLVRRQELNDAEAVELMVSLVLCASQGTLLDLHPQVPCELTEPSAEG